jgi:hypothetical protein
MGSLLVLSIVSIGWGTQGLREGRSGEGNIPGFLELEACGDIF